MWVPLSRGLICSLFTQFKYNHIKELSYRKRCDIFSMFTMKLNTHYWFHLLGIVRKRIAFLTRWVNPKPTKTKYTRLIFYPPVRIDRSTVICSIELGWWPCQAKFVLAELSAPGQFGLCTGVITFCNKVRYRLCLIYYIKEHQVPVAMGHWLQLHNNIKEGIETPNSSHGYFYFLFFHLYH